MDRMVKIDLRTVTMDVPPQDLITRDNVPARVNAVVYFRVVDPNKSVIEVENHVLGHQPDLPDDPRGACSARRTSTTCSPTGSP
jgi:regulator of protease activity HflC (stomatin/prohibitin superfamily)